MREQFVQTANIKKMSAAITRTGNRGAREVNWVLVSGEPGLGKTSTLVWLAEQIGGAYIRGLSSWTPAWLLADLALDLSVSTERYSVRALWRAVTGALNENPRVLLVDELDQIARNVRALETLRDLSDTTGCVIVAAGAQGVDATLRRHPQIWSRVGENIKYGALARGDVSAIAEACCELPLTDAATVALTELTGGRPRAVLQMLAKAERAAKRNGLKKIDTEELGRERVPAALDPRVPQGRGSAGRSGETRASQGRGTGRRVA